jgi:mitochondrial protein import protein ZIM17
VLIKCPGCSNRHLIADHLKVFSDTRVTLQDILKGEKISRGRVVTGFDGQEDVELWPEEEAVEHGNRNENAKEAKSMV